MKPILYDYGETSFTTQGLGVLYDAISCVVTEERNGMYECQMTYDINGVHFGDIVNDRIILAKPNDSDDPQPFRIYRITKPMNGRVTIYAEHASYQMSRIPVSQFTATNVAAALSGLKSNAMISCPFTFWTDKSTEADFSVKEPSSMRSRLGGVEGSILDVYGGEWKFDRFEARLYNNRGEDRGVILRYGKNITDISQENNIAKVNTGIVPFWKGEVDGVEVVKTLTSLPIVYVDNHSSFPFEKVVPVDLSDKFDEEPTDTQLRSAAVSYITANEIGVPDVSIKVSFIALWDTEEYKDIIGLEQVRLCDTVTVQFEKLGISVSSKVIRTVYDTLKEQYNSIELGKPVSNFGKTIKQSAIDSFGASVKNTLRNTFVTPSAMESAIDRASDLITGGLGGYVVMVRNANDQPEEILILGDSPDYTVAQKVWRWNKNGLAYSSTGYNGTYRTAITADGHIVADFMDTGSLNAALINVINLSASSINTGTMVADRISGGTLKLGGANDQYGNYKLLDAQNRVRVEMGKFSYDGVKTIFTGYLNSDSNTPYGKIEITEQGDIAGYKYTSNGWKEILLFNSQQYSSEVTNNVAVLRSGSDADSLRLSTTGDGYNPMIQLFKSDQSGSAYMPSGTTTFTYRTQIAGDVYISNSGRLVIPGFYDNVFYSLVCELLNVRDLTCSGTKNRKVSTRDYSERLLYCYETPSPMFGDVGEGVIGEDGKCYVTIDPIFAETVTLRQYQVFLQKYGSGECYVSERKGAYFIVEGTPNLAFGWELKAKQADFDQLRLDKYESRVDIKNKIDYANDIGEYMSKSTADYGVMAAEHINNIMKERNIA